MPVLLYKSLSVRVQDFANAWLAANKTALFMINPVTKQIIGDQLVDLPIIGFSTKASHPMGFIEPGQTASLEYEAEAVLSLEIDPKTLPKDLQKIEGEFWLFELKNDQLLSVLQPLADALFEVFGVNIVLVPDQVHDEDVQHRATEAVSAAFHGVVYCPIIPKREV